MQDQQGTDPIGNHIAVWKTIVRVCSCCGQSVVQAVQQHYLQVLYPPDAGHESHIGTLVAQQLLLDMQKVSSECEHCHAGNQNSKVVTMVTLLSTLPRVLALQVNRYQAGSPGDTRCVRAHVLCSGCQPGPDQYHYQTCMPTEGRRGGMGVGIGSSAGFSLRAISWFLLCTVSPSSSTCIGYCCHEQTPLLFYGTLSHCRKNNAEVWADEFIALSCFSPAEAAKTAAAAAVAVAAAPAATTAAAAAAPAVAAAPPPALATGAPAEAAVAEAAMTAAALELDCSSQ